MKNKRIRVAMAQAGITQTGLGEIIGAKQAEVSIMLKYELAAYEQAEIVKKIKEHAALGKGA